MMVVLLSGYIGLLALFVWLKFIPFNTFWKVSPVIFLLFLNIGLFINAIINFLIIAFVVFWIGKAAARVIRKEAAEPTVPPQPTRSEVLLEEIRDRLPPRPRLDLARAGRLAGGAWWRCAAIARAWQG